MTQTNDNNALKRSSEIMKEQVSRTESELHALNVAEPILELMINNGIEITKETFEKCIVAVTMLESERNKCQELNEHIKS